MDAIIELNDELHITRVNPATGKAFRGRADKMTGQNFRRVHFTIEADAPAEQLKELAKFSPVHDIVSNPVPVSMGLGGYRATQALSA